MENFFLADYIYSLNIPGGHDHIGAFATLTLFFASLTISTVYCCNVLVDLFPDFALFVDHDQGEVRNWYEKKLKWCYEGPWPLVAGLLFTFIEYFTIGDLLKSFTPDHRGLQGLRTGFQTAGFFFWA